MQGQAVPVADTQPSLWTETKKSWFCYVLGRSFKSQAPVLSSFYDFPEKNKQKLIHATQSLNTFGCGSV